jgi:hypothetical protein
MKNIPSIPKEQICKLFGCTMDQLNAQYAANATVLDKMHNKAKKTSKKVNGYTEAQLKHHVDKYKRMANPSITHTIPDNE